MSCYWLHCQHVSTIDCERVTGVDITCLHWTRV
jgi:hypothetical protein